ncbi:DegT/DnrJ/EryC1/StrS family aminotransferase [Pseudarthrobacter sp. NPDC092439]|uniref:DegT/DnrJ/EryC1/StrS family aminotransferase n=1 Tax=unclassified Pseudarthrobacter TaxID=2647000 RepID=UPI0037F1F578
MTVETALAHIDVTKPWLGHEESLALASVIASGRLSQGPRVKEFEDAFAVAQEARHAVATSSCTAALHLALLIAGVGRGDHVVVPSLSSIAAANAVTYVGARPIFCDVDPATGNVTAETIHAAITIETRAVIVADHGGVPADLEQIRLVCDRHEITVIEDAACAAGSRYRNRPAGSGSEVAVWSFHRTSILTTGEGGMLTTNRSDWAARARMLREHAISVPGSSRDAFLSPRKVCVEVGYDYRMTDLQAAVGTVQLKRLPEMVDRRRTIAAAYSRALENLKFLRLVTDPPYGTTNFQTLWLELLPGFPASRERLLAKLADAGISARRGTAACHRQPAFRWRSTDNVRLPHTERLSEHTLSLPVFHELDSASINRVVNVIRNTATPVTP